MDQTFMTIHNLSAEANILFASESIYEILGYQPREVQNKSCFDFFHPDEIPFARSVHNRGVLLDKAAVLHYARIRSRDGRWISCECCFTVVHDVLVACTSIYRQGERSQPPQIRRLFSSSPRDPRYQMLEHLSPKFRMPPMEREPRAALILNRFTRTLTVMFATNAVSSILGVRPDQIKNKSFYECIQENCLPDAIRCLESAKANDSIAYLRFWYRDPRREEDFEADDDDEEDDDEEDDDEEEDEGDDGLARNQKHHGSLSDSADFMDVDAESCDSSIKMEEPDIQTQNSLALGPTGSGAGRRASPSSSRNGGDRRRRRSEPIPTFELEAVVSCTSDGLVVVLRKARPPIPTSQPRLIPTSGYENGLFAAPWGQRPVQPYDHPNGISYHPPPPLHAHAHPPPPPPPPTMPPHMPLPDQVKSARGPPLDQLMRSIRDVAVFAWALVGINGNLSAYSSGLPQGEAQPPGGLCMPYPGTENQTPRWPGVDESPSQSAPRSPSIALPAAVSASLGFAQSQQQQQQQQQQNQQHQCQRLGVGELMQDGGSCNYTFGHASPPISAATSTREDYDAHSHSCRLGSDSGWGRQRLPVAAPSHFQGHYHQPRHLPTESPDLSVVVHGQQTATGAGPCHDKPTASPHQSEPMAAGGDPSAPTQLCPADQSFPNARHYQWR
ncbi:hypothetical protein SODALDRAFT_169967 [Sodiomyces alkalinus F11]|uniref:PAS domain-containing protein n=1 Tax=Sodiomyces alkalinus (strain CBS 110278 / VKM F-3762 / F11) TaxID=1314773 RepID=A0A3N2PW56_SODAK|nr:hypothetical protein SODALDRAFT_169967 [Sodiomyces alkalinus F11]ROT38739.1 hypothetical protein SODALDRAFT_169967 [Sodiomyces alkalinus F11]